MKEDKSTIADAVRVAGKRIENHVRRTYLIRSRSLSELGDANVYLKLENLQKTGSFKARGAINKLLSLGPEQRSRGCVAASTGNHGAAVAYGLGKLNIDGLIFVPDTASPSKVEAIRRLGGTVKYYGSDSAATEAFAREYASERGMTYVSPYNDLQVIAGQGTIGIEIKEQLERPDAIIASLGGGGLLSGIAGYLKEVSPPVHFIGSSPENSQVMIQSIKAGRILDLASEPTLSDGTAGGVEPEAVTFDYCRALVEEFETVTESEIKRAISLIIESHHLLIEGAAGVAVAAYLKRKRELKGMNVVIIICGGNIGLDKLREVLAIK